MGTVYFGVTPDGDRVAVKTVREDLAGNVARLGDLVTRRLGGEEACKGYHLYDSLELLFRMVNDGRRSRGGAAVGGDASEGKGGCGSRRSRRTCSTRCGQS